MKHLKACTILAALVLSAAGCSDDSSSSGIASLCGNNELNENEICDGTHFKDNAKVCPEGLILKDATAFECTQTCGLDFSKACAKPTCGDGEITAGEVCDQDKFREGVKVCPTGMEEVETPTWGCTQTCLLDITNACKVPDSGSGTCEPEEEPVCGDGKLTGREVCDGKLFVENVKACPPGQKKVPGRELFRCHLCTLDTTYACIPSDAKEPTLYISEIRLDSNETHDALNHLYIEIGNIGEETPISDCKLVGIKLNTSDPKKIDTKFVFEQSLADAAEKLGNSVSDVNNVIGVCYEKTKGWLKDQYNAQTKTKEECESFYDGYYATYSTCYNSCTDDPCTAACNAAKDRALENYYECIKTARFRKLSESCDIYIPSPVNSLNMTMTNWTQYDGGVYHTKDKLWGIGVMCGDTMHDMIKLDEINKHGGSRMCVPGNKLTDIAATGDTVYEGSYQSNKYDKSYSLSLAEDSDTFGEASCGETVTN